MFAVIITIMVLGLKPPEHATLGALFALWPTVLSYAVSFLFIAIVWVNHHHLLRFVDYPAPRLIWINFAHVFMVSLVPFSTAWVADTRFAPVPVCTYAAVFVLVNLAYLPFERYALALAEADEVTATARRIAKVRSVATLGTFASAIVVSLRFPAWGFALVCSALLVYLRPDAFGDDVGERGSERLISAQQ